MHMLEKKKKIKGRRVGLKQLEKEQQVTRGEGQFNETGNRCIIGETGRHWLAL